MKENSYERCVLLLSAGLDSAVNLASAVEECQVVLALTFDYGQRAAAREIYWAGRLARHFGVPHTVLSLPWLANISNCALIKEEVPIPEVEELARGGEERADAVWVPNRNGLMVNIAACYAESLGASTILFGGNIEEAANFPDNSPEFVTAANRFFEYSTRGKVELFSFTLLWDKVEIVKQAHRLGVPFEYLWSCYHGQETMCGSCESCSRLRFGIQEADLLAELEGRLNMQAARE